MPKKMPKSLKLDKGFDGISESWQNPFDILDNNGGWVCRIEMSNTFSHEQKIEFLDKLCERWSK